MRLDRLVDTTLREGEQAPSVYFRPEEKCRIAEMLRDILGEKGYIEIGQPYSPEYRKGVEAVVNYFREKGYANSKLLVHCRTLQGDVEIAKQCGAWGVVVVLAPSEKHLLHKLNGLSYEQALKRIKDVIRYAKEELGFENVQYTLEDATSMPVDKLIEVSKTAEEADADVVRIPDTKGQVDPESFGKLISKIHECIHVPIDVHCHNDRGLAMANAIAALTGGATGVHVSVLGLGERNGIVDLATLADNLESIYNIPTGVRFSGLPDLYEYVSATSGFPIPPNTPVLGVFSRTHKAGEHQKSVLRCPETYETIDWRKYRLQREYEFGAMQSKELISTLLREANVPVEARDKIVEKIRRTSMDKGRPLKMGEVWRLLEEVGAVSLNDMSLPGVNHVDAIIFLRVKPSCDELNLVKNIRKKFLEHSIPIRIRDIAGDWDFIVDVKNVGNPALLDKITHDIRRENRDILDTSTNIVFDEYK